MKKDLKFTLTAIFEGAILYDQLKNKYEFDDKSLFQEIAHMLHSESGRLTNTLNGYIKSKASWVRSKYYGFYLFKNIFRFNRPHYRCF